MYAHDLSVLLKNMQNLIAVINIILFLTGGSDSTTGGIYLLVSNPSSWLLFLSSA